jgi:SAM-dependent MidA family methyltransferase
VQKTPAGLIPLESRDILGFLHQVQRECGGVIPFERFMQEALYHPDLGYYSANIRDIGKNGDFSTSATLGEELGKAIALWISKRSKEWGWRRIPVIEIGAGNGTLCRSVLRHLDWPLRWRVDYTIHETSPILRKQQQRLLKWKGVQWASTMSEALERSKGRALIFSNELVDAFPCRLFRRDPAGWHEIGLRISNDGNLSEIALEGTSSDPWFIQFEHLPVGQRVERFDSYRKWLGTWSNQWNDGTILTIDYGNTNEALYQRRLLGSIRAYWKHQRFSGIDVYGRFGKQDLTADVNLSDLIQWGEDLGWRNLQLSTQRNFISALEGNRELPSKTNDPHMTEDTANLFWALEQQKLHAID